MDSPTQKWNNQYFSISSRNFFLLRCKAHVLHWFPTPRSNDTEIHIYMTQVGIHISLQFGFITFRNILISHTIDRFCAMKLHLGNGNGSEITHFFASSPHLLTLCTAHLLIKCCCTHLKQTENKLAHCYIWGIYTAFNTVRVYQDALQGFYNVVGIAVAVVIYVIHTFRPWFWIMHGIKQSIPILCLEWS